MLPIRGRGSESGAAMIEMAIALPIYLLIVFGLFECSIVLSTYCSATYACRDGARYASLHSASSLSPASVSQISAMVQSELFLRATMAPTVNVTYTNPSTGATATNAVGNMVLVSASWGQTLTIPFLSSQNFTIATQAYQVVTR
jgi:Flp pilus assembly protein TadG